MQHGTWKVQNAMQLKHFAIVMVVFSLYAAIFFAAGLVLSSPIDDMQKSPKQTSDHDIDSDRVVQEGLTVMFDVNFLPSLN